MSLPEVKLWSILRTRPNGIKFRRQHPLGRYVLDFYCPQARLPIEVDGIAHEMGSNPDRDVARDAWIMDQGVTVLRIPARDVLDEIEATVAMILTRCAFPLHHPSDGPPPHALHGEDG
jgi:very-short-patch-repair endonuclease